MTVYLLVNVAVCSHFVAVLVRGRFGSWPFW